MHPFGSYSPLRSGLFESSIVGFRAGFSNAVKALSAETGKMGDCARFDALVARGVLDAMLMAEDGDRWTAYGVTKARYNWKMIKEFQNESAEGEAWKTEQKDAYGTLRSELGWDVEADFEKMKLLATAYGLTLNELDAVGWYTSPQTGWRGGEVPRTEDDAYGQRFVARALTRAMRRLPSLRDLGQKAVCFRIVGFQKDERDPGSVKHLEPGTGILHGVRRMKNLSHHFMSTSMTPNVKGFSANMKESKEVLAIYGGSGRYIQWLGRHGLAMDGGEVLYPPGTCTIFQGCIAKIRIGDQSNIPVYFLVECEPHEALGADAVVDDFKFKRPPGGVDLDAIRERYATPGRDTGVWFKAEERLRAYKREQREREQELLRRARNIRRGLVETGQASTSDPWSEALGLARKHPGLRYRGKRK